MYDKYFQADIITTGSKIPKHKGILVSANAAVNFPLNLVTSAGRTFSAGITFAAGPTFFPMQVHSVASIPSGVTAYYLN
jgi:hypothetical protein